MLAFSLLFDQSLDYSYNYGLKGTLDLTWTYNSNVYDDSLAVLRTLKLRESMIRDSVSDYVDFLKEKLPIEDASKYNIVTATATHFDLNETYYHDQSWDGIIRKHLLFFWI